jgi:hypothetical protein
MIYFGGFTFDQENPATHLKIPNEVAANRIAVAVLERFNVRQSFQFALQILADDGNIEPTLVCYCDLMTQRDVTHKELTETSEENHRDSFYFCLKLNYYLLPHVEFELIKVSH